MPLLLVVLRTFKVKWERQLQGFAFRYMCLTPTLGWVIKRAHNPCIMKPNFQIKNESFISHVTTDMALLFNNVIVT